MNEILSTLLNILKNTLIEIFALLGAIIIIGFLLGLMEKTSSKYMQYTYGWKGVIATSFIGVPIHEFGHMIMCLLFRHKITRAVLLTFKRNDGTLGYVEHSYNPHSLYQRIGNFFIGIGPFFSGIFVLFFSMYYLLNSAYLLTKNHIVSVIDAGRIDSVFWKTLGIGISQLLQNIFTFDNLSNPYFWIFIIVAISVSSHIALSASDIKNAKDGLVILTVGVLIINIVLALLNIDSLEHAKFLMVYNIFILSISTVAIFFSAITVIFSFVSYLVKSLFIKHSIY